MKNKLLVLVLLVLCSITLIGCKKEITVESITIDETTIPSFVLDTDVENYIKDIKINVNYSDDSKETVNVTKSMLSAEDFNKLQTTGSKEVTISYEGKSVKVSLSVVNYTVTVLYPDNTPVTSKPNAQWCDEVCYLPVKVNSKGVAGINLKDGEYFIHLNNIPEGYTYDPNAYIATASSKHVTIKLLPLSEITNGDGTIANPYVLNESVYSVTYEEKGTTGVKYFAFTAEEAGTYKVVSLATNKLATNLIDPFIGFLGTDVNTSFGSADVSGNVDSKIDINFNYSFEAVAGTTYYFVVMVSSADQFPATFDIQITK